MVNVKEIIVEIETIEKERNDAIKETNELRIRIWDLEKKLEEQKKETEKWKEIALNKK